ncbi:MAG: DNA-formamidopyrimidine glycosylase family protein [Gammaproteobacteria bacterium]
MPELPDVETFRRYINATALHRRIERVHVEDASVLEGISPQTLGRRLKHRRFASTSRRGKYLFAELDEGGALVLHFGMTGHLEYSRDPGPAPEYTVMTVEFEDDSRLFYVAPRKLGHIAFAETVEGFIDRHGLGPDALSLDLEDFRQLAGAHHSAAKSFLMNQNVIAGVGNVYADEVLFQAKVHPAQRIDQLDRETLTELHRQLGRVLEAAIEAKADPDAMPDSFLLPHRAEGGQCPRCRSPLKQQRVNGRATYFCPRCQRAG